MAQAKVTKEALQQMANILRQIANDLHNRTKDMKNELNSFIWEDEVGKPFKEDFDTLINSLGNLISNLEDLIKDLENKDIILNDYLNSIDYQDDYGSDSVPTKNTENTLGQTKNAQRVGLGVGLGMATGLGLGELAAIAQRSIKEANRKNGPANRMTLPFMDRTDPINVPNDAHRQQIENAVQNAYNKEVEKEKEIRIRKAINLGLNDDAKETIDNYIKDLKKAKTLDEIDKLDQQLSSEIRSDYKKGEYLKDSVKTTNQKVNDFYNEVNNAVNNAVNELEKKK